MIIGIIIVLIGICCLLDNCGLNVDWGIITSLAFIFAGVAIAIKNKKLDFWPIILFVIGVWNLLLSLNIINISLSQLFWPLVLIVGGLSIVFSKLSFSKKVQGVKVNKDGKLIYNGIFGGVEEKVTDNNFDAIIVNAVFGGVKLDLTNLKLKHDIQIEVNSIFGGTDLVLSDDYNIVLSTTSIFGGTDNKHEKDFDKNKKNININSVSIFGGTDLK